MDLRRWHRWHDDLWTYSVDFTVIGAHIGRRMTAARDAGGGWSLIGPVPLDESALEQLRNGGTVRRLVVQTALHNAFVRVAHRDYPDATLFLAHGAKRDGLRPERSRPIDEWPGDETGLLAHPIAGMPRVNEVAFHHPASRSLILADWMMYFPGSGRPLWTRLFLRLFGWVPGPRVSRLYRAMIRDREAFDRSTAGLPALPVDRILPAHGVPLEHDPKGTLLSLRRQSTGARS